MILFHERGKRLRFKDQRLKRCVVGIAKCVPLVEKNEESKK